MSTVAAAEAPCPPRGQPAAEVLRETERALGIEPAMASANPAADTLHPVRAVHFSNFIIGGGGKRARAHQS